MNRQHSNWSTLLVLAIACASCKAPPSFTPLTSKPDPESKWKKPDPAPMPPRFSARTAPTARTAVIPPPQNNEVRLRWNAGDTIAEYRLHTGLASRSYTTYVSTTTTQAVITVQRARDRKHYFAVVAYDVMGAASAYSAEVVWPDFGKNAPAKTVIDISWVGNGAAISNSVNGGPLVFLTNAPGINIIIPMGSAGAFKGSKPLMLTPK